MTEVQQKHGQACQDLILESMSRGEFSNLPDVSPRPNDREIESNFSEHRFCSTVGNA